MARRQSKKQSKKRIPARSPNDAIALLSADHRRVEKLFAQWEAEQSQEEKQKLVKQVCDELVMHALLEEEVFYAACREKGVEDDSLDEAQVEHDAAKILIADVQSDEDDEFHEAKVTVLKEYVAHHVAEEEQPRRGIFARARAAGVDLEALAVQIKERKQQLLQLQASNELPQPSPKAIQLSPFTNSMGISGENDMARQDERYRDQRSRYEGDDDRSSRGGSSNWSDYDRGGERGSSRGNDRERDEQGRFMSDDDRGNGSRRSSSRGDYGESRRESREGGSNGGRGQGGWFGDSEGHSEASRRGWDERGSSRSSSEGRGGRGRDDDDYRSRSRGGRDDDDDRGQGRGGWFGDPEGHSEASRRGWEERSSSSRSGSEGDRGRSRSRDDDDDDRGRGRGMRDDDDRGRGRGGRDDDDRGRGWFGDSRGHAEAARRGWEERGESSSRGRSRDDDDRGRSRGGRDDEQGQGGWFGDPRGHSEAARRGWENRR